MDKNKNGIIMERYCPVVDSNIVVMKDMVKNDGSYRCISHTNCLDKENCRAFLSQNIVNDHSVS